jgi:FtsP/CotA-like multicopper oxidase with cupredoxin domain
MRPRLRPLLLAALAALCLGPLLASARAEAAVRHYWIAAVNTPWDVAPNGRDVIMGTLIQPPRRRLTAVVYRAYTRGWGRPLPNTAASADNDGIPGPLITARVGDTVLVHFRNEDRHTGLPHSMHFHAFRYAPSSDGAYIPHVSGRGANVPVGGTFTYRLRAVADSAGVWPYHDHARGMMEGIPRGLYGMIVVLRRGERPPDRRFVVALGNTAGFDTINGRAFIGNTPTFRARVGQTVEWNVMAIGENFHTFHVHGHRWLNDAGVPTDVDTLGPAGTLRVRWREDAPGTWYYHCHVESHMENGMIGLYRVTR